MNSCHRHRMRRTGKLQTVMRRTANSSMRFDSRQHSNCSVAMEDWAESTIHCCWKMELSTMENWELPARQPSKCLCCCYYCWRELRLTGSLSDGQHRHASGNSLKDINITSRCIRPYPGKIRLTCRCPSSRSLPGLGWRYGRHGVTARSSQQPPGIEQSSRTLEEELRR